MNLFLSILLVFVLSTGIVLCQQVPKEDNSYDELPPADHAIHYIRCPASEFCLNGGTCYKEVNTKFPLYLCKCPEKLYGENCQFTRTAQAKSCQLEIADHFCLNGGTCYEDSTGMNETVYYCECPKTFWGARCESITPPELTECSPIDTDIYCKNNATCYETTDEPKSQFCLCTHEYTGSECGFKVVQDNSSVILNELLCLNDGKSMRVMWQDVEIFGCSCQEGFYGSRCEYETTTASTLCPEKEMNFCLNGGTCYQQVFGSKKIFFCVCMTGHVGHRCEISLSTAPQECHLDVHDDEDIDDAFCANGGTCYEVHYQTAYLRYCECTIEFGGLRCQKKLPRDTGCPPPLDKEACENNGTCFAIDTGTEQGAFMCKCAEGYYGATCEYQQLPSTAHSECPGEILEFMCLNGGTCYKEIIMDRPFYYCECVKPFHGVRCAMKINNWLSCPPPLDTDLCLRGGLCSQVATHFPSLYFCQCRGKTFGARCEHCLHGEHIENSPCPPAINKVLCKNGGKCVAVRVSAVASTYFCSCPEGLYGMSCEYPYSNLAVKDACPLDMEKTYCLNGGTCYKETITGYTVYKCECDYPYTGVRCELMSIQKLNCPQDINSMLCLNSGSCTYRKSNGYDVYVCECGESHYGARCEHTFNPRSLRSDCPAGINNTLCKNSGVCVKFVHTGGTVYYCKCMAGFFGVLCEYPHSSKESTSILCPSDIAEKYCENGGTCYISRLTGEAVYYCLCPDSYYGTTCEFMYPLRTCPKAIAHNLCIHGTCVWQQVNGVDTYQCVCHPDHYGFRCEHSHRGLPSECSPEFAADLCKNNGTCVKMTYLHQHHFKLHYCKCPPGFYGSTCENPHNPGVDKLEPCLLDVAQSYCLNGGTCYRNEIEGQSVSFCECVPPYYGPKCEYNRPFKGQCAFPFKQNLCITGTCLRIISHGLLIYACACDEGWYGDRCEHKQKDISNYETCPHPLENDLCGNGGSCVAASFNESVLYFCKCRYGYYGFSCEYFDPSLVSNHCPADIEKDWCLHGGTCFSEYVMNRLVFRCECRNPFYGERCEKHSFIQLSCPPQMQKNLCYNGGSCVPITMGRYTLYYCICVSKYYGLRCEFCEEHAKKGLCPSHLNTDLCKNGGTCITVQAKEGQNMYFCKCPEGLYGLSCEYPYPHLSTVGRPCPACFEAYYCLNGGTCYREDIMGNSKYHCDCVYPYIGERCEVKHAERLNCPNQFHHFLCLNGGTCVQSKSNGYMIYACICPFGYYGPRCEHICATPDDPRESSAELCGEPFLSELCQNGGTCVALKFPLGNELYFCKCRGEVYGPLCEYPFLPLFHESAVCPPDVGKYFCLNGGTCYKDINTEDKFYYCLCPDTYFGARCELSFGVQILCPSLPYTMGDTLCLHGGVCVLHITYSHHIYVCQCAEGYYGPRCEHSRLPPDPTCPSTIDKVLCMNGGTCTTLLTEKNLVVHFCKCPDEYYGIICEYKVPPSAPVGEYCPPELAVDWCLNGGTCYKGSVMGVTVYYCHCVEGFHGDRCEIESPAPLPCPPLLDKFLCVNGGVCTMRILYRPPQSKMLYYCDCRTGYSGARCEIATLIERKIQYCKAYKWFCLNGGVCLQEVADGTLHCDCKQGYYGERCQLKAKSPIDCPPEYQGHICFNGGYCMIGSTALRKTVYCICEVGYLGQRCEFSEPKIKPPCPNEVNEFLCLNGGTCLEEMIDKWRLYYCECPEEYFGLRCEWSSPKGEPCGMRLNSPFCLNGGTCHEFRFSGYIAYYCTCLSGYHGSLCEYTVQELLSESLCPPEVAEWFCYNGGTCYQGNSNNNAEYYCICLKGIGGHRCEFIEDEATNCVVTEMSLFCKNHGTCLKITDTLTDYFLFCLCPDGYGGRRCDYVNHRIDTCPESLETSLCLNGGNCSVLIFIGHVIYYCECPIGFYGPRCQEDFPAPMSVKTCPGYINKHFCLNHGTCRQTVSQKLVINYCVCVDGFWGERCEYSYLEDKNCSEPYDQFYCLNGGSCYLLTVGKETFHHCECLKNFFGSRCESHFPVVGPETERCQGEIDTYFCQNGGTCFQIVVNNEVFYFCLCTEQWTGLRCEEGPLTRQNCPAELDDEYCLNGGNCIKLQVENQELYYCRCAPGFEGTRCEYDLPNYGDLHPCSSILATMYCLNGGTCTEVRVFDEAFYLCECPGKFWGKQCEFSTFIKNYCPPVLDTSFCFNGGTCYQLLLDNKDLYYCICTNNYYGHRCENNYLETSETQPCSPKISTEICLNGGSCYELTKHKVFYCECPEGYSGKRCEHPSGGHLISYLNMQHSLERSSSSIQVDICFYLLLLWFLCYKAIF